MPSIYKLSAVHNEIKQGNHVVNLSNMRVYDEKKLDFKCRKLGEHVKSQKIVSLVVHINGSIYTCDQTTIYRWEIGKETYVNNWSSGLTHAQLALGMLPDGSLVNCDNNRVQQLDARSGSRVREWKLDNTEADHFTSLVTGAQDYIIYATQNSYYKIILNDSTVQPIKGSCCPKTTVIFDQSLVRSKQNKDTSVLEQVYSGSGEVQNIWGGWFWQDKHRKAITVLACSPDNRLIISGGEDKTIKIWDRLGACVNLFSIGAVATAFCFLPDNTILIGTSEGSIQHWCPKRKKRLNVWKEHLSNIASLNVHPDGTIISTSLHDHIFWGWLPTTRRLRLADIQDLLTILENNSSDEVVTELNLQHFCLVDTDIDILHKLLQKNKSIKTLNLSDTDLTQKAIHELTEKNIGRVPHLTIIHSPLNTKKNVSKEECKEVKIYSPYDIQGKSKDERLIEECHYTEALAQFEKVLKITPNLFPALYGMARAYIALGQNDNALTVCETILKLDPNNLEANCFKAQAYFYKKQYSDAESILKWYVEKSKKEISSGLYTDYGNIYFAQKKLDDAFNHYNFVLESDPHNIFALVGKANALYQQGLILKTKIGLKDNFECTNKLKEALAIFEKVLQAKFSPHANAILEKLAKQENEYLLPKEGKQRIGDLLEQIAKEQLNSCLEQKYPAVGAGSEHEVKASLDKNLEDCNQSEQQLCDKVMQREKGDNEILIEIIYEIKERELLHSIISANKNYSVYRMMTSILICGTRDACQGVMSGYGAAGDFTADKITKAFKTVINAIPGIGIFANAILSIIEESIKLDKQKNIEKLADFFDSNSMPEEFLRRFARCLTIARKDLLDELAIIPVPVSNIDQVMAKLNKFKEWAASPSNSTHPIIKQARKDIKRLLTEILTGNLKADIKAMLSVCLEDKTEEKAAKVIATINRQSQPQSVRSPTAIHSADQKASPAISLHAVTAENTQPKENKEDKRTEEAPVVTLQSAVAESMQPRENKEDKQTENTPVISLQVVAVESIQPAENKENNQVEKAAKQKNVDPVDAATAVAESDKNSLELTQNSTQALLQSAKNNKMGWQQSPEATDKQLQNVEHREEPINADRFKCAIL